MTKPPKCPEHKNIQAAFTKSDDEPQNRDEVCTVRHGVHEWARDDDGDGRREVHWNSCEGAGAALRTYLRAFRGVHKQYLHLYVATYEAMVNAKRVTPELIQRMCVGDLSAHSSYT
jgi:transposase